MFNMENKKSVRIMIDDEGVKTLFGDKDKFDSSLCFRLKGDSPDLVGAVAYPLTEFPGLYAYLCVKKEDADKTSIAYVTERMLDIFDLSREEAYFIALKNTEVSTKCQSLDCAMKEMFYGEGVDNIYEFPRIFSNKEGSLGASAILNKTELRKCAEAWGTTELLCCPSSIHEWLVSPAGMMTLEEANEMVTEINHTQVEEDERLIDRAYVISVN